MKFYIILIIALFPGTLLINLFSQEFHIVTGTGIGHYNMMELKEFNEEKIESLPFETKALENFPMFWNYNVEALYVSKKYVSIGLQGAYFSTGSRISRVDYSGEYLFDIKLNAISPALLIGFYIPLSKYRITINNIFGISYSKIVCKEHLKTDVESVQNKYVYDATNLYYMPQLNLSRAIYGFRIAFYIGYHFDMKRNKIVAEDYRVQVQEPALNNNTKLNWNGIQMGISLSYNVLRNKISQKN